MFRLLLQQFFGEPRGTAIWGGLILPFVIFDDVPDELINTPKHIEEKYGQSDNPLPKEYMAIVNWVVSSWLVFILIAVLSLFYFSFRSTVFIVSANVEKLSISPYEEHRYPEWKFKSATIHPDCGKGISEVTGLLRLEKYTYIEFARVQNGVLVITLESDESDSVGVFTSDTNELWKLGDCTAIRLDFNVNGSYVFPIEGNIKLGGDIKESSSNVPILYSGEVTILDKALFTRQFYLGEPFSLMMGDVFEVEGPELQGSGFVHIVNIGDDDKGIYVTYSSKGKKGFIKKYKTEPIEIQNGFWTKIYNDPSLIFVWFFGIIYYAICRTKIRINLNRLSS